jgi:hypothetical protein
MTYIPTQSGFMRLEDSEKLLQAIFPKLEPRYPTPALEPIFPGSTDRSKRRQEIAVFIGVLSPATVWGKEMLHD